MHRHLDEAIAELARTQCSVFSHRQAHALGMDRHLLYRRRKAGAYTDEAPGVCGIAGTAHSFDRRLWTAHLALGPTSVVSHESAAAARGLAGFPPRKVVLTVPHGTRYQLEGVTVHQISDLTERTPERIVFDVVPGLPVTDVTRTLTDLAAVAHPARLGAALDDAVHRKLTTYADVGSCLVTIGRQGKAGMVRLAELLDSRLGRPASTSEAERRFVELVNGHLPPPESQRPLPGPGIEGLCDFCWPRARLIVEIDSRSWHGRITALRKDRERDAQAARQGWQTHRILFEHIRDDPANTLAELVEIHAVRLAQLGAA